MDELLLPCAVKACTHFCGGKDREDLNLIQVRSESGSPSLVMEATNGYTAIQITMNNQEFELDDFVIAYELGALKGWMNTGEYPEETEARLPDITKAMERAREIRQDDEFCDSLIQLKFWTETNLALRALFKGNVNIHMSAPENVEVAMAIFVEGESRDGTLVVAEIFIMRIRP